MSSRLIGFLAAAALAASAQAQAPRSPNPVETPVRVGAPGPLLSGAIMAMKKLMAAAEEKMAAKSMHKSQISAGRR